MIVGVPKEIKDNEYRVGITPAGADTLVRAGNKVLIEKGAGLGSGFKDEEYEKVGAEIVPTHRELYESSEMIMKVKEPIKPEYELMREDLILFAYLHLAAEETLTRILIEKKVKSVAYETVELPDGSLPLLRPMSEIAGKISIQIAAQYLTKIHGGEGKLISGATGVTPCKVVVIGAGTVGRYAAQVALGMGANVIVLDKRIKPLIELEQTLHGNLNTLISNAQNLKDALKDADVAVGAVLVTGAKAPKIVTRDMIRGMRPGGVIVDVSIDQGGVFETSRPTTHSNPTYIEEGVIHYCVANMPGMVPRTSTFALSNATMPYALKLANLGFEEAVKRDSALAKGANTYKGYVTHPGVAEAFGLEYKPITELI